MGYYNLLIAEQIPERIMDCSFPLSSGTTLYVHLYSFRYADILINVSSDIYHLNSI